MFLKIEGIICSHYGDESGVNTCEMNKNDQSHHMNCAGLFLGTPIIDLEKLGFTRVRYQTLYLVKATLN